MGGVVWCGVVWCGVVVMWVTGEVGGNTNCGKVLGKDGGWDGDVLVVTTSLQFCRGCRGMEEVVVREQL